jgi:hypothetical protein
MPTLLVCPVCGKEYKCEEPHEGPHDVLTAIEACPLTKGSLYVFVKDEAGNAIEGVKAYCKRDSDTTDDLGFAYFQQREADTYETRIDLSESAKTVWSKHYAVTRVSVPDASVEKGKITIVEFVLNRYADMRVKITREDGDSELPKATFTVTSAHVLDEPSKDAVKGEALFGDLKPTELYAIECALPDKEDRKNFTLVKEKEADRRVSALKTEEVVFVVTPRYWIELAIVDPKDPTLTGSFALRPGKSEAKPQDAIGKDFLHVPDLTPGNLGIDGITLTESREFVGIG